MKLASELQRRSTGRTAYVLDEPTTGLHFEDIRKLLGVLGRLVDAGNTVIVIEHNLDVIKTADWVVDMGPEGGTGGGRVVATGTPETVAAMEESHTGAFLREILGDRVDVRSTGGRAPRGRSAKASSATGKSSGTARVSASAARGSGAASRAKPAATRKPRTTAR